MIKTLFEKIEEKIKDGPCFCLRPTLTERDDTEEKMKNIYNNFKNNDETISDSYGYSRGGNYNFYFFKYNNIIYDICVGLDKKIWILNN